MYVGDKCWGRDAGRKCGYCDAAIRHECQKMKRLIPAMFAFFLSWHGPTMMMDGVTPVTGPLTYSVWIDGVRHATHIPDTSVQIPEPEIGVQHTYSVRSYVDNVACYPDFTMTYTRHGGPSPPKAIGIT